MVHVVADGGLVMTERIDYLVADGRSVALPVLGVFELTGPRIVAWRDHFDLAQFGAQWSSGRCSAPGVAPVVAWSCRPAPRATKPA